MPIACSASPKFRPANTHCAFYEIAFGSSKLFLAQLNLRRGRMLVDLFVAGKKIREIAHLMKPALVTVHPGLHQQIGYTSMRAPKLITPKQSASVQKFF